MKMAQSRACKLCVCGQSKVYPLCDGRHKAEGWMCHAPQDETHALAFVADPNLRNLADRLAHRFCVSLHSSMGHIRAHRLIVLTAGLGVDYIQAALPRVEADETLVVGIGVSEELVNWAFPTSHCVRGAQRASGPMASCRRSDRRRTSHHTEPASTIDLSLAAVADEPALFPPNYSPS